MAANLSTRERLPIRVLYVEDEYGIRLPMLEMMSRWVEDIIVAANGEEGLEAFKQTGADLVISDLKMPHMDGLEMIAAIKSIDPNVKTIVVSAHSHAESFIEAINIGVDGFLMKPVLRDKLYETIHRFGRVVIAQRNARLQEEKFMALAGSVIDAIIIINEKGEILFWNQAATRIFGYEANDAIAMPYNSIFDTGSLPPEWPSTTLALRRFYKEHQKRGGLIEANGLHKSGRVFPVEISVSPLQVDDLWYALFIIRDITERKQREKELIEARERAEAATRAKQQFLSVMSHEIRTPLNGILGTINLLVQEDPRPDQMEYLKTLEFSGNHLLSLINDILDFSKIEANRIQFESVSLEIREVVENLLKIFSFKAQDKGISIFCEIDPAIPQFVKGDPIRLNQILNNLIGNALKFTEKGGITVRVKVNGNITPHEIPLYFEVIDTGIGIPEDKTEIIFDMFSQADANTTRRFGGTGLGLAITKKLVELQGGSIGVRSKLGEGSTFYFNLNFKPVTEESGDIEKPADFLESLQGVRILLVEDNKINQMIAQKFLTRWGASIDLAENGLEALNKIQTQNYDIVLMDLQMPELDGYQATRRIRQMPDEYFQKIPIIALTASTMAEVKESLEKFGLDDMITKPFIPGELNRKIFYYTRRNN
ncbi:MAG: hypothetical protein PWP35_2254 [Bacteroidales bacterium]|jgi:PAS domain S-box-containing protein|nr:hypothetical protein [Bacteroidales bacterium]NLH53436.1 response regulator [Bacteroidales bacterium]NPV36807.1 response regulator [Bacteroidales bacterium]